MTYKLHIVFKSNENPFSMAHHPIPWAPPADDGEAIEWARGMASGLGVDYSVTLFKDEQVLKFDEAQSDAT